MAVFGVLLMLGALVAGLARRSFLSLTRGVRGGGVRARAGRPRGARLHRPLGVRRDARRGRADPDPVPRRARGGGGDAPARLAPAAPEAGARDAAHLRPRGGGHARAHRPRLDRVVPASGRCSRPTDPVLSSTVVTNPRVPRLIRHSLNLESGLNDGLALPAVLALHSGGRERRRLRVVAVRAPGRDRRRGHRAGGGLRRGAADAAQRTSTATWPRIRRRLYALGVAFAAYGTATLPPEGNGFIAVFVARDRARDLAPGHPRVLRGALRGPDRGGQAGRVPRVRGDPHLRRPVRRRLGGGRRSRPSRCWWRARSRSSPRWPEQRQVDTAAKAFMAWFGPKGVATMTFALFVLGSERPGGRADPQPGRADGLRCRSSPMG